MLNVHSVISELDKSYESEIISANVYHPPFIFVLKIIQARKKGLQFIRAMKITISQ